MNIRQCFAKDTSKAIEICGKLNEAFVYERYYVDKIANLKHELFMLAKKHHQKYGYDSFSDFCAEFGYSTDSISARETFLACGEEYAGLRRIFTEEQMEKMREIY